jgi:membrane-bound serine protease (ClpP class)
MMRIKTIQVFLLFVLGLLPLSTFATPFNVDEVSVLSIDSAITPATFDYLDYQFKQIPENSLILIKMNTPGGLISTTKDIITLINSQNRPVAVWVTPDGASAASAGAIIASAAHFILMSKGTNLGAATPVGLGSDISEKDGRSKALNDLKALVRSMGELRKRPTAPFEAMIDSAKSFTANEALNLKIIEGVLIQESAIKEVLESKSFQIKNATFEITFPRTPQFKNYGPTLGQQLLSVLANPSTAYFLFLIGVALLYFEFQAPGGYIAGGIGIVFLLLAAIAFQVLPLNWGSFGLLIVGVVLLVLEIYITSYGLLGLGGLAAFITGSLFLFHGEGGFISVDYPILLSTLSGMLVGVGVIAWYLLKEKKKRSHYEDFFLPVGSQGVVIKIPDDGQGFYQIKVRGEIWRAKAVDHLKMSDKVEVISIDQEKLIAEIKKNP